MKNDSIYVIHVLINGIRKVVVPVLHAEGKNKKYVKTEDILESYADQKGGEG